MKSFFQGWIDFNFTPSSLKMKAKKQESKNHKKQDNFFLIWTYYEHYSPPSWHKNNPEWVFMPLELIN